MASLKRALRVSACATLLVLAACGHESSEQMSWARAALERNPDVTIVAADAQSRTFTVRVKQTGELHILKADELTAGPALAAASPPAAAAPESAAPAAEPAAPAADSPAEAPEAAPEPAVAAAAPKSDGGAVLRAGPGYSIQAAAGGASPVMQSGPGYSIRSSGATGAAPERARLRDAGVTSAAIERRREPIVCQGERMLHIDNRNLEFDGDAVAAEDGCEIHITNSHISATGVGVLARNANVHIENSLIEGDAGSIDASQGAQVYASSSHFRGLSRREDSASFHDLGGNIWN